MCLFWIPASIAEAVAVISNGAKTSFFSKGTATFFNGPVHLLNNNPNGLPDWSILEIWALESLNQSKYCY